MNFISDSLLYISGETYSEYNINTNTYNRLWQLADFASTDREKELVAGSTVKYENSYIYLSGEIYEKRKLMKHDLENPDNNSTLIDLTQLFPRFGGDQLISVQYGCDSTALYFWGTPDIDDESSYPWGWYKLDPYTGVVQFSHLDPKFPVRKSSGFPIVFKHYNTRDWEDCEHVVNLDEDESTMGGLDFLIQGLCTDNDIPISDIDIRVSSAHPLDSIRLHIDSPQPTQSLSIPSGNYTLWQPYTYQAIIRNNGTTTNADFEAAIRSTRYNNTGQRTGGDIIIEVIPYYGGIAGQSARAILKIQDPLPYAGDDYTIEGCVGDAPLALISTLSEDAGVTGQFWFFNQEVETVLFDNARTDTVYYVTQSGQCRDTAVVAVMIHEVPVITPQADVVLCSGQTLSIDLSGVDEDVVWSDGTTDRIKEITTGGTYSYTIGNFYGCTTEDSFELLILPAATEYHIDTLICRDDVLSIDGTIYDTPGIYTDTIQNYLGCDSIVSRIVAGFYDDIPIVLDGDLGLCPDESTTLMLPGGFKNIQLNGQNTTTDIEIKSEGQYTVTATDPNGCPGELTFNIIEYPAPDLATRDLIDTIFTESISLPVTYYSDIDRYQWTPLNGALDCYDCPYPQLLSATADTYTISVVNEYGCSTSSDIRVSFKETSILLPSVIANHPNIEENGRFYVKGDIDLYYDMSIYDRWGNLVFDGSHLKVNERSEGWHPNGRFVQGVYVYVISYIENGVKKVVKGDITVL